MILRMIFQKRATAITVCALSVSLALVGCSKDDEKGAKAEGAAKAAEGASKAAEGAKKAAAKVGAAAKAAEAAVAKPALPDVELKAGSAVVGWASLQSLDAVFDAVEAVGTKTGQLPPGGAIRQQAYDGLTGMLAQAGITGHSWIAKDKPVYVAFQDDSRERPDAGVILALPIVSKDKATDAMKGTKLGEGGHGAVVEVRGQKSYVDFIDGYAVVTNDEARFGKAKDFLGRLTKVAPPSLVYLGVSVEDLAKTRSAELEMFMAALEKDMKAGTAPGLDMNAYADGYSKLMKQYVSELARFELLVDAGADDIKVGFRAQAKKGTGLEKILEASRGRSITAVEAVLPTNSYLTVASNQDPTAASTNIADVASMLGDAFKMKPEEAAALKADLETLAKLQKGDGAFAAFQDGKSMLGLGMLVNTAEPDKAIATLQRVVGKLLGKAIDQQREMKGKDAEQTPLEKAIEASIRKGELKGIVEVIAPVAREQGITLALNEQKVDGGKCDVLDVKVDWTKVPEAKGGDAEAVKKLFGDHTAAVLCAGGEKIALAVGPSGVSTAKDLLAGKKGGLVDAPSYKKARGKLIANPEMVMFVNPTLLLTALKGAMPQVPDLGPGDHGVAIGCGHRARSMSCDLNVPVSLVAAITRIAR